MSQLQLTLEIVREKKNFLFIEMGHTKIESTICTRK